MADVRLLLKIRGPLTAVQIRQALQMTHEQVYELLVRMHSLECVAIRCDRTGERTWVWA